MTYVNRKLRFLQLFNYGNSIVDRICTNVWLLMHKLCRKINKTCKNSDFFQKTIDKPANKAYTVSNNSKGAVSFTGLQRLFVYFTLYFG